MSKSRYVTSGIGIYKCLCKKCGNDWESKRINRPSTCPKCHSKGWNKGFWVSPKQDLTIKKKIEPSNLKLNLSEKKPLDKLPDRQDKRYGHNIGGSHNYKIEEN